MSKPDPRVVFCVAAAASLASCATPGGGSEGPVSVVQFSYDKVEPQTVRIPADGSVNWVNLAEDTDGFIVLPLSMGKSFRCSDLGPTFSRLPDGYRSQSIRGMQGVPVSLPCALAPGRYDYEIWLVGVGFSDEVEGKRQVLHATIVVE